jgi:hypothetical protein
MPFHLVDTGEHLKISCLSPENLDISLDRCEDSVFTNRALAREEYYSFPLKRRKAEYIELLVSVSRCEATLLLEKKRQIAMSSVLTTITHTTLTLEQ